MTSIKIDRIAWRRGVVVAMLGAGVALFGCNTEKILDTSDPDNTPGSATSGPAATGGLYNSALGDFQVGFSGSSGNNEIEGLANMTGLFTDEFFFTETFPTRIQVDRRNIFTQNVTMRALFSQVQRGRVSSLRAATSFAQFDSTNVEYAEMENLQAYAIVLMGEAYCSGVPLSNIDENSQLVPGVQLTTTQLLQTAADTFQKALNIATALGDANMMAMASVGLARTKMDLNKSNLTDAATLVANVPTDFRYVIFHSANSARQWNGIYEFTYIEGRWGVAEDEGINGLNFRSAGDPRVTHDSIPGAAFDGSDLFGPRRYSAKDSSVILSSGIEARLIEAEAKLAGGDAAGMLTTLNALRSGSGLALPPLADPGNETAREDLLFRERAFWMYGTAHRVGDMRRLSRSAANGGYGRDPETVFPTGPYAGGGQYGTDTNFPLPIEEQNNPNVPRNGTNTCLDRNP